MHMYCGIKSAQLRVSDEYLCLSVDPDNVSMGSFLSIDNCPIYHVPGVISILFKQGDQASEVRAVVVQIVLYVHPLHEDVGDEGVFGSKGEIRAQHLALKTLGWNHQ